MKEWVTTYIFSTLSPLPPIYDYDSDNVSSSSDDSCKMGIYGMGSDEEIIMEKKQAARERAKEKKKQAAREQAKEKRKQAARERAKEKKKKSNTT